jgi:hypothetical protein
MLACLFNSRSSIVDTIRTADETLCVNQELRILIAELYYTGNRVAGYIFLGILYNQSTLEEITPGISSRMNATLPG